MTDQTPTVRGLPHDRSAEIACLGSMRLEAGTVAAALEAGLDADDFYVADYARIFRAMRSLYESGKVHPDAAMDDVLLKAELRAQGATDLAEGHDDLFSELGQHVPSLSNTRYYAGLVRGMGQRRRAIDAGTRATAALYDLSIPLPDDDAKPGVTVEDAADYRGELAPPLADAVIEGVVRRGCKLALYAPSKSYKTHLLLQLCACLVSGKPFLDWPTVTAGNVLFVNPELQRPSFYQRWNRVCAALGVDLPPGRFSVLHLRGKCAPIENFVAIIEAHAKKTPGGLALIAFDSIYKLYGDRSENDAGDMTGFLNVLDGIEERTGAAVAFTHHFAKGAASAKSAIDRSSGSGVLARDPDSIITLTPHASDGVFTVELTLRDFPPVEPFCVEQVYPLMQRAPEHDPANLRRPGTVAEITFGHVEQAFTDSGRSRMTREQLILAVKDVTGRGTNAIRDVIKAAIADGKLVTIEEKRAHARPQVWYGLKDTAAAVSYGGCNYQPVADDSG